MSALHLIRHGAVAELKLDNPAKLNAFTVSMLEALDSHCEALERDDAIRAVVLTAAESRAFCAGADIAAWSEFGPAAFARRWVRGGHRIFDKLARLPMPSVAAVSAHAFGGGLELIAACDVRLMAPTATLALPEAQVGVVPGWSGTQRLVRLIGEPAVKEMALFGRRLSAERAVALGFAAALADDPRAEAFAMAERLLEMAPRSIEVSKYMIHAAAGEDAGAAVEALGGGMIGATADRGEGVAAFAAKRPPRFTGA